MVEELEFDAYLNISNNKFGIYLFDKINMKNIYQKETKFNPVNEVIDIKLLILFLEDNIFKIEKLIGRFIKNIILIIESSRIYDLNIGIKKKDNKKTITKEYLKNTLTEVKDLVKETYQNQKIMHMIVNKYLIDGNHYSEFLTDIKSNHLCLEVQFILIPNNFVIEIDKVLEKYQIKIVRYLSEKYTKNLFIEKNMEFSLMVFKVLNYFNVNEVEVTQKNHKKYGFFERFFQLFS